MRPSCLHQPVVSSQKSATTNHPQIEFLSDPTAIQLQATISVYASNEPCPSSMKPISLSMPAASIHRPDRSAKHHLCISSIRTPSVSHHDEIPDPALPDDPDAHEPANEIPHHDPSSRPTDPSTNVIRDPRKAAKQFQTDDGR
ncbi:hypothetical protein ACLOJK_034981 [Asimina triloba]